MEKEKKCSRCKRKRKRKFFYVCRKSDGTEYLNSRCIPCVSAAFKEYCHKNPEKRKLTVRQFKQNNPTYFRDWERAHPEGTRRRDYRKRYGIGVEEYEELFIKQDGKCAICGKPESRTVKGKVTRLAVEHDHETGKVRGLACHACNRMLGFSGDCPERLEAGAAYLRKFLPAKATE